MAVSRNPEGFMARMWWCVFMFVMPIAAFAQSRVATPTFSISGGEHAAPISVVVEVSPPDAVIRLTRNGHNPTESDPIIVSGSPLTIDAPVTLKARAWKTGLRPSAVRSAAYTFARPPLPPPTVPVGPGDAAAAQSEVVLALPDGRVLVSSVGAAVATEVDGLVGVIDVAAGAAHFLAVTWDGFVYAWGDNGSGRLGDGTQADRAHPAWVAGVRDVVSAAAGRAHSLALTRDGRVFGWGANGRGQLGIGGRQRATIPTEVQGLSNVVAIAAGDAHSVALLRTGEVFTWGSNRFAQLGIGVAEDALRPVRAPLSNVVAVAAGGSHTLALLDDGSVFSWGAGNQGQLGTGARVAAAAPDRIDDLRAVAVAAGRNFSAAVRTDGSLVTWGGNGSGQLGDGMTRRSTRPVPVQGVTGISSISLGGRIAVAVSWLGEVWMWGGQVTTPVTTLARIDNWGPPLVSTAPATPTIEPASATYATPQTVSMSTSNGAVIRYTLDGTDPTFTSTPFTIPFTVATATEIRARAFTANGGEPSDVASALLRFHFGSLPAPIATPDGGFFQVAPQVLLSSIPGAVIRYTIDGTAPTGASPLYVAPIAIAGGMVLTAQAFHVDWSPGVVLSERYDLDTVLPVISASVSPSRSGWHSTPPIVSFTCSDNSGRVFCPAPMTITSDGADQTVTGRAVDEAGNQAVASVVVSVDITPPLIAIPESVDGSTTLLPELALTISVSDAMSGVAAFRCNGQTVEIVDGSAPCLTRLRPGVNSVMLQALDHAGNLAANGLVITRAGIPTTMTLTPDTRTMVVDEVQTLSLRDEFGGAVAAEWTSSDPTVATLSDSDPPLVTALAPGSAVVSATRDGMTAASIITVDPGPTLAPGTIRWNISPTPGATMAAPIFTHRVDPSVPPMFLVETQEASDEAILRAVTADGEMLWKQYSPGTPLMGDAFGGVVVGVPYVPGSFYSSAYLRLGTAGQVPPWRYDSAGILSLPAQAPDGTLYALEYLPERDERGDRFWRTHAVIVDGRNGSLIERRALPRDVETFTATADGDPGNAAVCGTSRTESAPEVIGPIVGSDGRGYLLIRRRERHQVESCLEQTDLPRRTIIDEISIMLLSPDGQQVVQPIYAATCDVPRFAPAGCDRPPTLQQIMADGVDGVLAVWNRGALQADGTIADQSIITRRSAEGALVDRPMELGTEIRRVGQNGIVYRGEFSAFDVVTGETLWTRTDPDWIPMTATPAGGATLLDPSSQQLHEIDAGGAIVGSQPFVMDSAAVYEFDQWIGHSFFGLSAQTGQVSDATRWTATGNRQRQLQLRTPGLGIFAKSHAVQEPITYQHMSIRVTPTFQDFWKRLKPADFVNRDEFGNYFMTIGAGTADGDSNRFCLGALTKGINRERDVAERPVNLEQLPVGPLEEVRLINDFYVYFDNYKNDLPYACVPEMHPGKYNSNSFVSGLLRKAGAPLPLFPTRSRIPPGWATPVPAIKFDP
jgi:hypothetical protein